MKPIFASLLRLAPAAAVISLLAGGCAATSTDLDDDEEMYPDIGETKGGLSQCGTALISWNGTTAYSNGANTGTGYSCAGAGDYGLRYQCVELVMRHFKKSWGLRWYGNAKDLLNNAPTADVDVYKNGDAAHPPVPGDMIVFGGGPYGHVSLVTEVTDTSVTIIEQNVKSSFTRTLARDGGNISAGWTGWWTMGWAHAKANGASSGGSEPATWSCGSSAYDGQQYWTCDDGVLHRCEGGQPVEDVCDQGCIARSLGQDDLCISSTSGWSCGNSAYDGGQFWTCNGGNLYRCSGGTQQMIACPSGCTVKALGTDDACK
jgi:surface antigen